MRKLGLLCLLFALGACGHDVVLDDEGINAYPANYKSDILAAMHAYLNNPSGIRDAAISEPALKWSGTVNRSNGSTAMNGSSRAVRISVGTSIRPMSGKADARR